MTFPSELRQREFLEVQDASVDGVQGKQHIDMWVKPCIIVLVSRRIETLPFLFF